MNRAAAGGLAVCALLNAWVPVHRPFDPLGVRVEHDTALETAAFFAVGSRRLAADLAMIRLLIYYGSPEEGGPNAPGIFVPDHPERSWGGGSYPELSRKAKSILDVDPAFGFAALFASGALAFNLSRSGEALEVLDHALRRDPGNARYKSYAAAVGFAKRGDVEGVIRLLEPTLADPATPILVKHQMAFLYRRHGHRDKAMRLYREILETTTDEGYRRMALAALRDLEGAPPRSSRSRDLDHGH